MSAESNRGGRRKKILNPFHGAHLLFMFGLLFAQLGRSAEPAEAIAQFPPEVRRILELQRVTLSRIALACTERATGTLPGWNYGIESDISAHFDGHRLLRVEVNPGAENYNNQIAFDGANIWRRSSGSTRKTMLAEAEDLIRFKLMKWSYLDMAGLYAPSFASELKEFTALEPLVLHYLEKGFTFDLQNADEGLRVTFLVQDTMAARQTDDPYRDATPPRRKVALLLEPKYGYAPREVEEWNAKGAHIASIHNQRFKQFGDLWLPTRCVAEYYARPYLFTTEVSDHPVHTVTATLTKVDFAAEPVEFALGESPGLSNSTKETHLFDALATEAPHDSTEKLDLSIVQRICSGVTQSSKALEIVSWLSDVYGPRLTGSPNTQAACDWTLKTMTQWGLSNVHLEKWSNTERGWANHKFAFRAIDPRPFVIEAMPEVWSPGTKGVVAGPVIRFDPSSFVNMRARFDGKLSGAFLLMQAPRSVESQFAPPASRLTDARLDAMSKPQERTARPNEVVEERYAERIAEDAAARHWLSEQGVAALLFSASGQGAQIDFGNAGGAPEEGATDALPVLKLSAESYGRLCRIVEKKIPLTVELEMVNALYPKSEAANVIAEIPGADPRLKSEVVMLGAHLDSWTFATGATDNAVGCAVALEAMRILQFIGAQPRRTIRVALWTGEEQGAKGSAAYVKQHFGGRSNPTAEHASFSVYFNLDGGTGRIRGFWLCNPKVTSIFSAWMRPFNQLGVRTASPWDVGGGDDLSFARAGLPAFGFIQDPIEYNTRTHHTSEDLFERVQPADVQFNSAFVASVLWHAAQREERIPR